MGEDLLKQGGLKGGCIGTNVWDKDYNSFQGLKFFPLTYPLFVSSKILRWIGSLDYEKKNHFFKE